MKFLSRTLARVLLVMTLLSPVAQVHTDHASGGSSPQSLFSVVMEADSDAHDETVPHEDVAAAGMEECTDHPAEIQTTATFHSGSHSSVQVIAAFVGNFMYPQSTADNDRSSSSDIRQRVSTHKPTLLFLRV